MRAIKTSVKITRETLNRLAKIGHKGESYEQIILRLLDLADDLTIKSLGNREPMKYSNERS